MSKKGYRVDCHTHLWRYPGELTDELARETFIMRNKEVDLDITPDMHMAAVAEVDCAIVFGLRAPLTGFFTVNDTVADYVRTHPEKLIGFAAICPTEDNALEEVERAVKELGLRGLKMSPIYGGWDPLDANALAIFARAEEYGLPILFHQGATFPRKAPLKYANPVLLEEIALRFPDLKMIIAHLGYRDPTFSWVGYPEDGLVLHLGVRDLPREVDARPSGMKREAHNQDYVWFRREEVLSMVPPDAAVGDVIPMPEGLIRRLVRYHLADYVRGETSSWPSEAIRDVAMTLTVTEKTPEWVDLRLSGSAQLFSEGSWYEGACRERGLDALLLGYLRFDLRTERFVRFDVVAVGSRWGGTDYNVRQEDLEPAPIGIAMTIAGQEARDRTAPHACQSRGGLERYFNA